MSDVDYLVSKFLGMVGCLKDKDPNDNLCNNYNSTKWEHDTICEKCMNSVEHEERMTGICLSCGERFCYTRGLVATREIMHKGSWSRQINWGGEIYVDKELFNSI